MTIIERLDELRKNAEIFAERMNREYYLHLSGQKRNLEIVSIFLDHSELFEHETLKALANLLKPYINSTSSTNESNRQLLYLWQGAVLYRSFFELGIIEEEQNNMEASLTIETGDGTLPWRQLGKKIRTTSERKKRTEIVRSSSKKSENFLPIRQRMVVGAHTFAKELDFRDYCELSAQVKDIKIDNLLRQTRKFLAETDKLYKSLFFDNLSDIVEKAEDRIIYAHDLQFFLRKALSEVSLSANGMVTTFEKVYNLIDVPTKLPNLKMDLEVRPTKTPRAYCLTPRVPDEVILMITPTGSVNDYRGIFHEGGHALHYAFTDPELPLEYRILGDNTITETWAFLSESLFNNRFCLEKLLKLSKDIVDRYLALSLFEKLLVVRSYCVKLEYETRVLKKGKLELSDNDWFTERYQKHLFYKPFPWSYMFFDAALYSAQYLQAWMLEAHVRNFLMESYVNWNINPETGQWLITQWGKGQKPTKDELAKETGASKLDISNLLKLIIEKIF
ncbi:MAG: hypothetical protein ACFFCZ_17955 [Promethearchaeota archaeon]